MDIIYTQATTNYKGNEVPEGKYRLDGISKIARKVAPEIDPVPLIQSLHTATHLNSVKSSCENSRMLAEVPTDRDTYDAALKAVILSQYAVNNEYFACTRPPGHHATTIVSKGFCFFNNIAVVTQNLIENDKKVCIIDFDGHQGDGTEEIFYHSEQVIFFSIHQEYAYPYHFLGYRTDKGYDVTVDRHGSEKGDGFTVNIPVPIKSGDDILLDALKNFIPTLHSFDPDYIGLSCGFDGYFKDSLLDLNYSLFGYYHAGKMISALPGKKFGLLEGGYHHDVIDCIQCFTSGMNNKEYPADQNQTTSNDEKFETYKKYLDRSGLG